jgi:hypothetical protein
MKRYHYDRRGKYRGYSTDEPPGNIVGALCDLAARVVVLPFWLCWKVYETVSDKDKEG